MVTKTRFSDYDGRRRARETWEKHQALVSRAGGISEYLKGAVPRREPEGKVPAAETKEAFFVHVTRQ